ncbi:YeiH family protein [Campylobacter volucris]|uniref:YeiH family protein n=1 Tax=Campylobacter volucris TaxID=1031542 RepID=UPI001E3397D6|nr:putative sulfate exporter family transporter [Campylobacter volucris]
MLKKEDFWAITISLFVLLLFSLLWFFDLNFVYQFFNIKFNSWHGENLIEILNDFNFIRVWIFWLFFVICFLISYIFLKYNIKIYIANFSIIFLLSLIINFISANKFFKTWQIEAPLTALIIGLCLNNCIKLPNWFKTSLTTEFYVKIGIILMGATLPLTLLIQAGAVAILQACIITTITFFSIYFISTKIFKLDPRFGATLSGGGSICGVSAAIVIGKAADAKKEHISATISIVIFWAILMIIFLPFLCKVLQLDAGVAGAWIGTSEFADAAGIAAASALGDERAVAAFTLIKVLGRDMFIGIWAVLVAFLSIKFWHTKNTDANINAIWKKFPIFIIGFIFTSIITTLIILLLQEQGKNYQSEVLPIIKDFRNQIFIWTFLCIGLSANIKEILSLGYKPLLAFSLGVAINLPLGFILSNYIFVDFWVNFLKQG